MADHDRIVESFADALRTGNADELIGHLAPGAIVWHNHDRQEVDAEATLRGIGALTQLVGDRDLEIRRVAPTPDGFVMQFAVRGTVVANGKPFEMQNCVIVTVVENEVMRIDEYVDGTVAAQLA
jgi:ketosteroid isomerase-like protein